VVWRVLRGDNQDGFIVTVAHRPLGKTEIWDIEPYGIPDEVGWNNGNDHFIVKGKDAEANQDFCDRYYKLWKSLGEKKNVLSLPTTAMLKGEGMGESRSMPIDRTEDRQLQESRAFWEKQGKKFRVSS
jgi:hypothetical protein